MIGLRVIFSFLAIAAFSGCQSSTKEPEPGTVLLACVALGAGCHTLGNSGAGAPVAKPIPLTNLPGWEREFKFRKQFYTCINSEFCPKGSFVTHSINIVNLEAAKGHQEAVNDPEVEGKKLTKELIEKVNTKRTQIIPRSDLSNAVIDNKKGIQQTFYTEGKVDKRLPRGRHFVSALHENENHIIFGFADNEQDAKTIATLIAGMAKF